MKVNPVTPFLMLIGRKSTVISISDFFKTFGRNPGVGNKNPRGRIRRQVIVLFGEENSGVQKRNTATD